jgi:CRISPR system Cascade subunit CasB
VRFIGYLDGLTGQRARVELAASLRQSPGRSLPALRWLARWTARASTRDCMLYHLIAALHATHPAHAPGTNLGGTLARVARQRGLTPSLERRFTALLKADLEDLAGHLRRVIGLARDSRLPLDWAQLLADLRRWDDPEQRVQQKWAETFWTGQPADTGVPAALESPSQ